MPNVTRLPDRKSGPPEQRRRYRAFAIDPRGDRESQIFPRKDLALAWAVRREEELRRDAGLRRDDTLTLSEWAPQALAGMRLASGTRRNYQRNVDGYLLPAFGDRRLVSLRRAEVERWLDRLVAGPGKHDVREDKIGRAIAPATAASILGAFKALLREAIRDEHLATSPLAGTRTPHIPDSPPRFMAEQDALAVIAGLPDWARPLAMTLLYTGARPGEACALEPQHVDAERGWLSIAGVVREDDGCHFEWSPQTKGKRHRQVPLPGQVLSVLNQRIAATADAPPAALVDEHGRPLRKDLIFRGPDGGPVCRHDLRDAWLRATEAAGVTKHRLYDLRHTYATLLCSAGRSLSEIGELLGHAPGSPATAVYAALMPAYKNQVRVVLERPVL